MLLVSIKRTPRVTISSRVGQISSSVCRRKVNIDKSSTEFALRITSVCLSKRERVVHGCYRGKNWPLDFTLVDKHRYLVPLAMIVRVFRKVV